MSTIVDHTILAKTRAEEHDADVWGEFFIPPYFNRLALTTATKSTYILGKRGCGKTMLLKYLDYHTAFSPNRKEIPNNEINHIGIYWRVDTQFCNSLKHRGLEESDWVGIFENYFSIVIAIEIIRAVRAISKSLLPSFTEIDFENLKLESATDFHPDFPVEAKALETFLEARRRLFTTWISNMASMPRPILPPGRGFLDALITDIRNTPSLQDASFYVYADEVENLVPYQRRVLNAFLKHSQKPFIVSFTSKVLSDESATTGPESVNATHDFRLLDLDYLLEDSTSRSVFFAEVFLGNLDKAAGNINPDLLNLLLNPEHLAFRQTDKHKDQILEKIRKLLPGKEHKEIALEAINNSRTYNILNDRIDKGLAKFKTKIVFADFMKFADCPEAIVVVPALLNRSKHTPDEILIQLNLYQLEKTGSFATTWVQNNLMGALLELYRPFGVGSPCPVYSGFDTFCIMAHNNLRHFLILCYKTLEIAELMDADINNIPNDTQARAALEAANKLILEIKTFGEYGARLRMFVLRLGQIFRNLQSQPAMSEPEQNQFTINSGNRTLENQELAFLNEAIKHAILFEQLETKAKSSISSDITDYQLNPIYAPYFQISYRRKRKISISIEDFHVLALGTEDDYRKLLTQLVKATDEENPQHSILFEG